MQECLLHVLRPNPKFFAARTARAVAALQATHILAHLVMEQNKAGIQVFFVINKKDDARRGDLRQIQKTVGEIICTLNHDLSMAGKRKQ
jgi:formylmethanofuran:tetrahydromethanopterin formyltransferase